MEVNNISQKMFEKSDLEQINEVQKENDINKKENKISNNGLNEKGNKDNNHKNMENIKNKINNKNNEKEIGNKRINNFINYTSSNAQHNRYYSTNTSNHYFRNFIKKSNYNKNRDNSDENNEQKDSDINNHFNENRPLSFTSRYYYMNKGLDYIVGNSNINNIYNKGFLDNKKSGYNYKNYVKGKRNNYVNKNIFFKGYLNEKRNIQNINESNYNNLKKRNDNQRIIDNKIENFDEYQILKQSHSNYILMNEILNLDNIDKNILNIANNILDNFGYKNKNDEKGLLLQYLIK